MQQILHACHASGRKTIALTHAACLNNNRCGIVVLRHMSGYSWDLVERDLEFWIYEFLNMIMNEVRGATSFSGSAEKLFENTSLESATPPAAFIRHCAVRLPLFWSMPHALSEQRFTPYEYSKYWVNSCIGSKDKEFFRLGIQTLPERWKKVIASDGQYLD
ncbi:Mariner Mos1 transposase [Eumeta japonica]|uniref:Mariner Mos1 transposase n=1 Tax=Eumeta variegata TaxID=151549 RepID=A0A4C1XZV3_EUMVA|nr:Mariner Mos1 transposase [Eumeta japonica]